MLNERNLTIQALAMPAHTNPNGDIFGGWLVSQMDLAGGIIAKRASHGRITTVSIDSMVFLKPVHIGDLVCCFATLLKIGRTSMQIKVDVEVCCHLTQKNEQVTAGLFTYVAIDANGKSRPVLEDRI